MSVLFLLSRVLLLIITGYFYISYGAVFSLSSNTQHSGEMIGYSDIDTTFFYLLIVFITLGIWMSIANIVKHLHLLAKKF